LQEDEMVEMEIYLPQAPTTGTRVQIRPAARVESLNGKRIGLLWNHKARGDVALDAIGKELQRRFRDVRLVHVRGTNPTNDEVLTRAASDCDVVIGTSAD
jgi:hypothetical protein